jgi:hypothetical protein
MNNDAVSTQNGSITQSNTSPGGDAGQAATTSSANNQESAMNENAVSTQAGLAAGSAAGGPGGRASAPAGGASPAPAAGDPARAAVTLAVPTGAYASPFGSARALVGVRGNRANVVIAAAQRLALTLPGSALGADPQVAGTLGALGQIVSGLVGDRLLAARLKRQLSQVMARIKQETKAVRNALAVCSSAAHVAAKGDRALLADAGFLTAAAATKLMTAPGAPPGFTATAGPRAGTLVLDWGRTRGVKLFVVAMSFAPVTATSWGPPPGRVKRKMVLKGLPPGQTVSFRVAGVSAGKEQGPWSEVASVVVP